jgi:hypothetical protein
MSCYKKYGYSEKVEIVTNIIKVERTECKTRTAAATLSELLLDVRKYIWIQDVGPRSGSRCGTDLTSSV